MDVYSFFLTIHLIGAAIGLGGATFIEVFLNQSLRDGVMDPTEKVFMGLTFKVLRIGLAIAFISGLYFVWVYIDRGQIFRLTNPVFISKMLIIVILVLNAVLLHMHKMKLWWGSTLSLTSWYFAFILGTFLTNSVRFGFWEIMNTYVLFVVAGGYALEAIRNKSRVVGEVVNKVTITNKIQNSPSKQE